VAGSFEGDDQATDLLQHFVPPISPNASFVLLVVAGPDSGKSIRVDGHAPSSVILGQSPVCHLRFTDPSVSRRHVSLDVVADGLRVTDLGSTNGTFLGAIRVYEAQARGGEELSLGGSRLRITVEGKAEGELPAVDRFGTVLGASRAMRRLFPLFDRIARSTIPILVEGETGTGKEAVAQALHDAGPRSDKPFVIFDCTAIAPNLIESELFGHEKGAFTGATAVRRGVFEQAAGGTLFIDELGDLPKDLQAKLLRAIDTGQVRRVGGDRWIQSDARLMAATRRDLEGMILEGRFRDDLFHRLAVGRVFLPPLRERVGDVPLLIDHFCEAAGTSAKLLRKACLDQWMSHTWPGNVRELRNAVARELALGELSSMEPQAPIKSDEAKSDEVCAAGTAGRALEDLLRELLPYDQSRLRAVEIFQQHYVDRALRAANGNASQAAAAAGIAVRYFHLLRAKSRRVSGS
jgi:transcriptional regulator with GAF, ATPase, and Fis domain